MIVDAAVHPLMGDDEYRQRLPSPWRNQQPVLPAPFGKLFEAPFPEIADLAAAESPAAIAETLFGPAGVDAAVLTPLTRGLLHNPQQAAAVATATNEWLYERWLDGGRHPRLFGAIRLAVEDAHAAVREIERWAEEPSFVQVAVPLRAFAPYGDERYFPIWEAAAEHGLPVYVQDDLSIAVEHPHSPVGQPLYFAENDALRTMSCIVHLASLITSDIHSRLPGQHFLFGDGGSDMAMPLLWRLDSDWRNGRSEVPWLDEPPSVIAGRFGRFVSQAQDGTADGSNRAPELARISRVEERMIYGSHRPYWDEVEVEALAGGWDEGRRARVLGGNALDALPRLARLLEPARRNPL